MKYSLEFKEKIVQKVLSGRRVKDLALEIGVCEWSIYDWIKKLRKGTLISNPSGPRGLVLQEKHKLLLESKIISDVNMGEWLRKKGLHSDHLLKWEEEIADAMNKNSREKIEIKKLQKEIEVLKNELQRKDRALSEAAVLLTLKKKYSHLWEGEEK